MGSKDECGTLTTNVHVRGNDYKWEELLSECLWIRKGGCLALFDSQQRKIKPNNKMYQNSTEEMTVERFSALL